MPGIILTRPSGTSDAIELTTDSTAAISVLASFSDYLSTGSPPVSEGNAGANYATAQTNTAIVSTPATNGLTRMLHYASIYNSDAALSINVTITANLQGTRMLVGKWTLNHGDRLEFTEANGWVQTLASSLLDVAVFTSADVVNATTSLADITGLIVNVKAGHKYTFFGALFTVNNASTTGSQFAVNGPTMTSFLAASLGTVTPSVSGAAVSEGSAAAVNTILSADTTGSTSVRLAYIAGAAEPSADGVLQVRCASEVAVAAGITVKRGSWFAVQESSN